MNYKYSNLWQRLADFYLSSFFHLLITACVVLIVVKTKALDLNLFSPDFWLFCLWTFLGYHLLETVIEGLSGVGIAKQFLGMRLMDANKLGSIGLVRALLRTLFAIFSFLFLGLGFIAIAFNKEHRALHDLLTGARVVNTPKTGFSKFFSIFMTVISVLPGLIITFALITALSTLPLGASKSLIQLSKHSSFELELFKQEPGIKVTLPYKQKRVAALTEFHNLEFIEYELDPLSKYNYIKADVLQLIGAKIWDYDFMLTNWQEDLTQAKLKAVILIPKMTFKDRNDKDLVVYNQKYIVNAEKTVLGSDLLDLFNYEINDKTENVAFSLYTEDQTILNSADLDDDAKKYLLYVLRTIRSSWREYQASLNSEEIAEFVKFDAPLANNLIFDLDTASGYIKHVAIDEPSKNEVFNKTCEKFIRDLPRFIHLPESLKAIPLYSFKMNLRYQEIIEDEK